MAPSEQDKSDTMDIEILDTIQWTSSGTWRQAALPDPPSTEGVNPEMLIPRRPGDTLKQETTTMAFSFHDPPTIGGGMDDPFVISDGEDWWQGSQKILGWNQKKEEQVS